MGKNNQVAFWAGLSAFFGTLIAIGAIDVLNPSDRLQFISGIFVGLITAGAVYSKQRLDDAKKGIDKGGVIRITEVGGKKTFTLELDDDPEKLEAMKEVIFKIHRAEDG